MDISKPRIGFVGQGFIGKNYADDFEARGYPVVRYALEEPYAQNKHALNECVVVFIAVPAATTPEGFDDSIIREAVGFAAPGSTVVIKSTMPVGTTKAIQEQYPDRFVMHSPEFLAEKTAAYDAAHPTRNIVGIPKDTPEYRTRANEVLALLPSAPFSLVCDAGEAELIKYACNCFLVTKVVYANMMHDLAVAHGASWEPIRQAMAHDPRIGDSHLNVVSASGHSGARPGRGAGGHCFIKDFAVLRAMYEHALPDDARGIALLHAIEKENVRYLHESGKDLDLLHGVYGPDLF